MYYFKDHLNFTNNLQDNLYILRQRQLKEAVWSPSSGGVGIPESDAGNIELESRMRNIKQSGDRQQSKEYLEMEAELNRRKGPRVDLDPSIKQSSNVKTDKVAGDWVERYAQKLDMDPRKVEAIRRGVIDMDTSGRGEDPISQTQNQVAQRGVEAYDRAKQFVVNMQKRDADKKTKTDTSSSASSPPPTPYSERGDGLATPKVTPPTTPASRPYYDRGDGLATPKVTPPTATQSSPNTAAKPESTMPGLDPTEPPYFGPDVTNRAPGQPYVVPGSQDWNNMSHDEQHVMAVRALINNETHKFTGGRNAVDPNSPTGERARFSEDSGQGEPFSSDINYRSKLANAVIDQQRLNQNRAVIDNWNRSDLADNAITPNRPWFWPKPSNIIPDTGADAGGYGPPKPSNNIPDTGADAGGYGPPKPKENPVSVTPPSSSPRAGGRPMVMYDMDGIPVYITPPTPKPSTEYSTDIIDQGKLIIGQESVNDILDRMRKPEEKTSSDWKETLRKEVDDKYNKQKGSDWARDRFSLKNYFELRRDGAAAYARAREDYKTASSKPSWAK